MRSFQNLLLLQNLYRLKALGFEYSDSFFINQSSTDERPHDLVRLAKSISTCHLCDLGKSRSQSMSGYGNPSADLMIIDYVVSPAEDSANTYYCGRSGEMLKNMIENVLGMKTQDVYFTHALKCKPLNSNAPSSSEWDSCKEYLFSQIRFVKPKVIVTLGKDAYEKLTCEEGNFQAFRGHVIDFKDYKLVPIHHPNHLLRNPEEKKTALGDLMTIKGCL